MSGVRLHTDLSGLAGPQAALERLRPRLEDLSPLMDDIGSALVASTLRRFEDQQGPDGKRWAPLSELTKLNRVGGVKRAYTKNMKFRKGVEAKLSGMKILQRFGHLRNSINHQATRDAVEIGTPMLYGAIHQFGGQAGRGNKVTIPARPFLGLDAGDEDMILDEVQAYLSEALP